MVVYFLGCWRPPKEDLKYFMALCKNFLWGGDPWIKKMAKVKWYYCCIPKAEGGLGTTDIREMVDRLLAKWILRGILHPNQS